MRVFTYSKTFCSLLGMVLGYLIFHPYSMLVFALLRIQKSHPDSRLGELGTRALMAFEPEMLPMALAFVLFGGCLGFVVGLIMEKHRKLVNAQREHEKSKVALETLNQLMVTLSHYLLNANMVIGGNVRLCRKGMSNEDILPHLNTIEHQARRIDAVIESLRQLTEIKTTPYTTSGRTKMIDITQEVEARLQRVNQSHEGAQGNQN